MRNLKPLLYILIGFVGFGLAIYLVAGDRVPESHPLIMGAFILLFAVPPVGAFWMMYACIRYEKKPFPVLLLAFVPFSFLWYYFERHRSKGRSTSGWQGL